MTTLPGSGQAGVAVPGGLDDLTPDWLSAALAEGGRLPGPSVVDQVRQERIGESTGFLGRLARLHLRYRRGSGPATLVAKLPTDDAGGRLVGRLLDVWNRESRFFAEVAPACGPQVPTCYYNGADIDAERWALLLEDRGPGQPADQLTGATRAQAEAAVDALADLQRRFRGQPVPYPWMPGFHRATFAPLQGAMAAALPTFTSRYGSRVPPHTLGWLAAFVADLPAWAAAQGRGPLTLVHADYRLDNLTFAADGAVTLLDWQTTLWGPGPMDLASFVATSLTIDERRRQERGLLARYAAGTGASADEVERSYRSCLLWWMAIFANNLSRIDPADQRGVRLFEHMIDRTFTAADDWEAGELTAG